MAEEIKTATTALASNEARPDSGKVVAKKVNLECAALSRLEATGADSMVENITNMTGDPDFAQKFIAFAKIQIKNAWKKDKATGKWTNDFNLVPLDSVLECLYSCARRKVLPDGHNAYLVVYTGKNPRCQLLVDYKGLIDTAIAEGIIIDCDAKEARENDIVEISFGEVTRFDINPKKPRGEIIGCCAYAILPNGRRKTVYLDKEELVQIRECAQTDEVWGPWLAEMYKKSAIRRLFKTTRNTPRMTALMQADNDTFDLGEARPIGAQKRGKEAPVRSLSGNAPARLESHEEAPERVPETIPVEAESVGHSELVF